MKTADLWFRLSFIALIASPVSLSNVTEISHGEDRSALWIMNMIPNHYNQREVPTLDGAPAKVKLVIRPWTIGEISLEHMHFFINMYISLRWTDHRLIIPNEFNNTLDVPDTVSSRIWIPHVTFRNCMACEVIQYNKEKDAFFLHGKEFFLRTRINAKLFCDFDIANYPMDSHYCRIEVQSAQSPLTKQLLIPSVKEHAFLRPASLPQFTVQEHSSGYCLNTVDKSAAYLSCVEYKMKFVRKITYHVMLTYCPCLLIVVLSWISFWLDIDLAAPRVALGLTSLLTLSTQFSNAQKNLPPVSYLKAIDVWFIFCMFMVFASLVEFAVCYTLRKIEKKKNHCSKPMSPVQPFSVLKPANGTSRKTSSATFSIDVYSRIAFPGAFFIFNLCYWSYYGSR